MKIMSKTNKKIITLAMAMMILSSPVMGSIGQISSMAEVSNNSIINDEEITADQVGDKIEVKAPMGSTVRFYKDSGEEFVKNKAVVGEFLNTNNVFFPLVNEDKDGMKINIKVTLKNNDIVSLVLFDKVKNKSSIALLDVKNEFIRGEIFTKDKINSITGDVDPLYPYPENLSDGNKKSLEYIRKQLNHEYPTLINLKVTNSGKDLVLSAGPDSKKVIVTVKNFYKNTTSTNSSSREYSTSSTSSGSLSSSNSSSTANSSTVNKIEDKSKKINKLEVSKGSITAKSPVSKKPAASIKDPKKVEEKTLDIKNISKIERVNGKDRISTSVEMSKKYYKAADTVIIARSEV